MGLLSNTVFKIEKGFTKSTGLEQMSGINYYDKKSNSIRSLNIPGFAPLSINSFYLTTINLMDGQAVKVCPTKNRFMQTLTASLITSNLFLKKRIVSKKQYRIFDIKENDTPLMIGNTGSGINKFDINNETFEVLKFSEKNTSSDEVTVLHKDNKGTYGSAQLCGK